MRARKTKQNISIKMGKRKIKLLKKVLAEVSVHFEGAEEFIYEPIEEMFAQEKISTEEVTCFIFVFVV